jgi:hypothetical protein
MDPDEDLVRWTSASPNNYGRFRNPQADARFRQHRREIDEGKRGKRVQEMQRVIFRCGPAGVVYFDAADNSIAP